MTMTNIAEKLRYCPIGTKLYSPLFGEVEFVESESMITVKDINGIIHMFFSDGKFCNLTDAECLLFPSKEVRTWEGWQAPKPHYDISNFKPFDKVLVRNMNTQSWRCGLYSHYIDGKEWPFMVNNSSYKHCIPYEGNEHLLGTTDMCDECYINW